MAGNAPPSPQYSGAYRQGFQMEQPQQLSSRQLIMNDYLTSQQMHGQQRVGGPVSNNLTNTISIVSGSGSGGPPSRQEKESPSPRSMALGSPASMYYGDKDRERTNSGQSRAEYMSRSSPADHR